MQAVLINSAFYKSFKLSYSGLQKYPDISVDQNTAGLDDASNGVQEHQSAFDNGDSSSSNDSSSSDNDSSSSGDDMDDILLTDKGRMGECQLGFILSVAHMKSWKKMQSLILSTSTF